MTREPLWITEADVVRLMHLGEAIDALEEGLRLEAGGGARNMEKTAQHWGKTGTMHAIGAVFEPAGIFGTKTWGNIGGGSTPLLILWDAAQGRLRAVIEATALGQMRTGAMSAVATRWMSAADADELAVIGSGKQAGTQVAGVLAVRAIRRIRVFSPTPARRAAFAQAIRQAYPGVETVTADSVAEATADAPIVTLITRAREPFLKASMLARGAHVNAAGAITEERCEFAQDLFARAGVVVVDSLPTAQRLSREFIEHYGDPCGGDWSTVRRICELVGRADGRPADCDLSIFKPMGMGISDLALGTKILERAVVERVGRSFPHPVKVPPRLCA